MLCGATRGTGELRRLAVPGAPRDAVAAVLNQERGAKMRARTIIARIVTVVALALAVPALAQTDGKTEEGKDPPDPKVKVERGKGGKKVYRITQGFVIEGRIQKPNAFYVLQRSQINYDWAGLKQKFVPRILDAVRKSPF